MTSFYVPCVVIVLLYWRIFRVIHSRTRQRTATARTTHIDTGTAHAAGTTHADTRTTHGASTQSRPGRRQLPDIYVVDSHHHLDDDDANMAAGTCDDRVLADVEMTLTAAEDVGGEAVCEDRGVHTRTEGRTRMRHNDTEGRCVRTEVCTHTHRRTDTYET